MNEIQVAGAALTSIKTAYDIAKTMVGLRDANAFREKALELNGAILSAQESALAARDAQTTLVQRVSDLEKEIADLKAWDGEKQRYHLTEVGPGVFAYESKVSVQPAEPAHLLCAKCYQDRKKSILQATRRLEVGRRVHFCPECTTELAFSPRPGSSESSVPPDRVPPAPSFPDA